VMAACNEGNATKNGPKSDLGQYRSYKETEGDERAHPSKRIASLAPEKASWWSLSSRRWVFERKLILAQKSDNS
jgi:hypothetical protein